MISPRFPFPDSRIRQHYPTRYDVFVRFSFLLIQRIRKKIIFLSVLLTIISLFLIFKILPSIGVFEFLCIVENLVFFFFMILGLFVFWEFPFDGVFIFVCVLFLGCSAVL